MWFTTRDFQLQEVNSSTEKSKLRRHTHLKWWLSITIDFFLVIFAESPTYLEFLEREKEQQQQMSFC